MPAFRRVQAGGSVRNLCGRLDDDLFPLVDGVERFAGLEVLGGRVVEGFKLTRFEDELPRLGGSPVAGVVGGLVDAAEVPGVVGGLQATQEQALLGRGRPTEAAAQ